MDTGSPLLAVRLAGTSYALEPGRSYVLGSAADCDFVVADTAPQRALISVSGHGATLAELGGAGDFGIPLRAGDSFVVGTTTIEVVADDGSAAIVPLPGLRLAARARRQAAVRTAAAALRRHDATFQDLLAEEMRRTPWLLTSLLLHAVLLLLAWVLTPERPRGGRSVATISVDTAADAPSGSGAAAAPEVRKEQDDRPIVDDPEPPQPERPPVADRPAKSANLPTENARLATRQRTSSRGSGRNAVRDEQGSGSGSFAARVAELQESGLEIVFVFDSTGSMTRTIADTKSTIVDMLDVLRSLVPDARIGLVTYRDRDRREDYVVRQAPLDRDYWQATNFVQFVSAEGGGDRPEDVRAGLNAAFQQQWQPGARRVVVLAGDAPPHVRDLVPLLGEVESFAADRRSFVHALVTSPDRAGDDTVDAFRRIAAAGRGECEPIENHERVLQRVLSFAFGREFDRDLGDVVESIGRERERVDVFALHLARQGGDTLRKALLQRPVDATVWNAVVRRPRQANALLLLDMLASPTTPLHSRHAVAAALQRMLDLPVPPIDPGTGEPVGGDEIDVLRRAARRLEQ